MNIIESAGFDAFLEGETHKLELQLAEDVAAEARTRAPVRTGELRDSITVQEGDGGVQVVAAAPYAAYVELGTRHMPAEPYLMPSLHERSG